MLLRNAGTVFAALCACLHTLFVTLLIKHSADHLIDWGRSIDRWAVLGASALPHTLAVAVSPLHLPFVFASGVSALAYWHEYSVRLLGVYATRMIFL